MPTPEKVMTFPLATVWLYGLDKYCSYGNTTGVKAWFRAVLACQKQWHHNAFWGYGKVRQLTEATNTSS